MDTSVHHDLQTTDKARNLSGFAITYDAMGNPISYLGATLSWNGKQLTGYSKTGTNVTYAYNEDGLRTQKTHNGTTTNYYYNGSVLIGMQSGNTVQRFSYDAQGKVVSVNYNGTEYYYLRNAQGDIVKLIDNNKNTVVEYTYDSWGKLISTTGSLATSLGKNQPFRYRGYVYDTETQWYYLQSRYYDPNTCRFISSDVYLSTGQGVIGHNSYAYCGNNPIVRADTQGDFFFTVTGTIFGAIGGGISAALAGENVWEGALSGAASGAIAGAGADIVVATAATGGGALAIMAGLVALGGLASEMIDNAFAPEDKKSTTGDYVVSALTGAAFNLLSFGMAGGTQGLKEASKEGTELVKQVCRKAFGKQAGKGVTKKIFTKSVRRKIRNDAVENIGMEVLGNVSNNVLKQYRRVMKRNIISMGSR